MAHPAQEQDRCTGYVPVVKIARHPIENASDRRPSWHREPRLNWRINSRPGAAPWRNPVRDCRRERTKSPCSVERIGGPGCAARDRYACRILPGGRGVRSRSRRLRSARSIARHLRHHVELPHDVAGLRIEGIHPTLHPLLSPPALPMNTSPFQAMGAAGTDSPLAGSAMVVDHRGLPFFAAYAMTRPSAVPRNTRLSSHARPRLTFRTPETNSSWVRQFCLQVWRRWKRYRARWSRTAHRRPRSARSETTSVHRCRSCRAL